jgi:hypothetical protein
MSYIFERRKWWNADMHLACRYCHLNHQYCKTVYADNNRLTSVYCDHIVRPSQYKFQVIVKAAFNIFQV